MIRAGSARASAVTTVGKHAGRAGDARRHASLVDGKKRVPVEAGRRRRASPADTRLWGCTDHRVDEIDLESGKRTTVLELPRAASPRRRRRRALRRSRRRRRRSRHAIQVEDRRAGPIALAAGDGKLYVATKEGPLVEIDRATGKQRTSAARRLVGHARARLGRSRALRRHRRRQAVADRSRRRAEDDRRHGRLAGRHRPRRSYAKLASTSWDARRNIPASSSICSTPPKPRSPIAARRSSAACRPSPAST